MTSRTILTDRDVASWQEEIESIDQKMQSLAARRDRLRRLLASAAAIMDLLKEEPAEPPEEDEPDEDEEQDNARGQKRWVDIVLEGVSAHPMGVISHEFKEEMYASPEGDRLRYNDKGYYNAIRRLVNRKRLIKHKGRLFSPEAYHRYMAAVSRGEIEDIEAPAAGHSPVVEAAKQLIWAKPGVTSGEVVEALKTHPVIGPGLPPKPTAVYNMISRLRDRKVVIKIGYKLYPATPEYEHLANEDGATKAAPSKKIESGEELESAKTKQLSSLHPHQVALWPRAGGT